MDGDNSHFQKQTLRNMVSTVRHNPNRAFVRQQVIMLLVASSLGTPTKGTNDTGQVVLGGQKFALGPVVVVVVLLIKKCCALVEQQGEEEDSSFDSCKDFFE